jgi:palmitoyltransferase
MDHHCPWTTNCVSQRIIPHFMRFVLYSVISLSMLEYFLYIRARELWSHRNLPSYLGPSLGQVAHFLVLLAVNSFTFIMLSILLIRFSWSMAINTTTIESWEIDRHKALVRRARVGGGFVDGPGGQRVRVEKVEFPYDVGFWTNFREGMGTPNVLQWLNPFAPTLPVDGPLSYPIADFADASVSWPPVDPDRLPRPPPSSSSTFGGGYGTSSSYSRDEIAAFRRRQAGDLGRHQWTVSQDVKTDEKAPGEDGWSSSGRDDDDRDSETGEEKEEGWTNVEGERLRDYGVDEGAEVEEWFDDEHFKDWTREIGEGGYGDQRGDTAQDEDDIPLAELMRRRGIKPSGIRVASVVER